MKKVKGNNKGFSLVELIVVIAIMAILAVTLAPRLSHYVERSRVAADKEVVHTVFTAAKLAYAQFADDYDDVAATGGVLALGGAAPVAPALPTTLFARVDDGKTWNIQSNYEASNEFVKELRAILKSFKLQASDVSANTQITITIPASGLVSVTLDYDTTNASDTPYTVSE